MRRAIFADLGFFLACLVVFGIFILWTGFNAGGFIGIGFGIVSMSFGLHIWPARSLAARRRIVDQRWRDNELASWTLFDKQLKERDARRNEILNPSDHP